MCVLIFRVTGLLLFHLAWFNCPLMSAQEGVREIDKFPKAGDYTIQVTGAVGEQYGLQAIPAQ